jgi:cleavage and polyadenylation specificity factor subunit 3
MAAQPLEDTLTITPLGSGQEVGRSCHLIQFRGRTVLLDCGIHPGRSGLDALPFLDTVDLSEVDLMLVSHFHIDHAAGVPYITEKTNFQGRVFMTHPTKAVMRMLLSDYIRLLPQDDRGEGGLYDEEDLARCCDRVELVDFHQVVEHEGIRFWSYNAGHVLGCVEVNRWFGGSPPNFRSLYLNQIEVDSADFWTDRLLSSSSRSTAKKSGLNRSITRTLKSG